MSRSGRWRNGLGIGYDLGRHALHASERIKFVVWALLCVANYLVRIREEE